MAIEYLLLVGSLLILINIAIAKLSDMLGKPAPLLISCYQHIEGPKGICFDGAALSQYNRSRCSRLYSFFRQGNADLEIDLPLG